MMMKIMRKTNVEVARPGQSLFNTTPTMKSTWMGLHMKPKRIQRRKIPPILRIVNIG
jgi:hypothetical protein